MTERELIQLHDHAAESFKKVRSSAEKNEALKRGEHWGEKEKRRITEQGRLPYSISLTAQKINTIISAQRRSKTTFSVMPLTDPGQSYMARLAELHLEEKEKLCRISEIESQVFDSGLSVSFGAAEIYRTEGSNGTEIRLRNAGWRELMWDPDATDYMLDDAAFMIRKSRLPADALQTEGIFSRASKGMSQPVVTDTGMTEVLRYYLKVLRKISLLRVTNRETGLVNYYKFAGKSESEKKAAQLKATDNEDALSVEVLPWYEKGIDKITTANGVICEEERMNTASFPFLIFRSFHSGSHFWCLTDLLRDPQRFIDRIFTQIDFGFGKDLKNVFQGNLHSLADIETPESAVRKAEQTGGIIWTRTGEEAFKPLRSAGVNPQYFQAAAVMQSFIEDLSGGRSFQGLSEYYGESGAAINAKQKQGYMIVSLFLDNLRIWRKELGKRLLEYINVYEDSERIIPVFGKEKLKEIMAESRLSPFLTLNENGQGFLRVKDFPEELKNYHDNRDFELVINNVPAEEEKTSADMQLLSEINRLYPGYIRPEIFIAASGLDDGLKNRILRSNS
ncbi:MAG: hypothetical protein L6Q59_15480 [Ignavibacteriaceae bacterium]|nr:hypothetical protein [Ignavibacteriaceae bacterium]